ncbi:MAG: hypothetical protein HC884_03595, partial [Chloroflexaceae bacterium]|nr:hypothetical protein [Chloroflexaceae bacterium]
MTDEVVPISDREREVLELVVRGASNKEIAQRLNISIHTVKVHLRNMFGKASVSSRVQLMTYAIERHLVTVGQPANEPPEPNDTAELSGDGEAVRIPESPVPEEPSSVGGWSNGATRRNENVLTAPTPRPAMEERTEKPEREQGTDSFSLTTSDAPLARPTTRQSLPNPPPRSVSHSFAISPRSVIFFLVLLGVVQVFTIGLIFVQMGQRERVGGTEESGVLPPSSTAATSTETISDRWKTCTSMPVFRDHFAVVAYEYDTGIYVIGGSDVNGASAAVSRYDPFSDTWASLHPKPTAVGHVQAVTIGGMIYVPGGERSDGTVLNILESYDPRSQQWSTLATMPVPRSRYALASFEGKLYLFGGWDGHQSRSEVFLYDPASNTWEPGDTLSVPRLNAGAAVVESRIHVIGGENEQGALSLHERYDPTRPHEQRWESLSPLPMGVANPAVVGLANNIVVVFAPHQQMAMQYVPSSDSWNQFTIQKRLCPL